MASLLACEAGATRVFDAEGRWVIGAAHRPQILRDGGPALPVAAIAPGQGKNFDDCKWTALRGAFNLGGMTREHATLKKRVGSRIRQRRNHCRMSLEVLAFDAGLVTSYISQIENGKRNPSLITLYRLATALHVDLAELVKA